MPRLQQRAPAIFEKCLELVREAEKHEEQCRRVRNVICRAPYCPPPDATTERASEEREEPENKAAPVATALSDLQLWPSEATVTWQMSAGEELRVDVAQDDVDMEVPSPMPALLPAVQQSPFPMVGACWWTVPSAPPAPPALLDERMDASPLGEIVRTDQFLPMAFEMAERPTAQPEHTIPAIAFPCFPTPCVSAPCVMPTVMGPLCDVTAPPNAPPSVTAQSLPRQTVDGKRIRRAVRRRNSEAAASTTSFQSAVIDAPMNEMPRFSEWSFETATDRSFSSGFGSPILTDTIPQHSASSSIFDTLSSSTSLHSRCGETAAVCTTPVSYAPPSDKTSPTDDSHAASFCLGKVSHSGRGNRAGRRRRFSRH